MKLDIFGYLTLNSIQLQRYNSPHKAPEMYRVAEGIARWLKDEFDITDHYLHVKPVLDELVELGLIYESVYPLTYGMQSKGETYLADNRLPVYDECYVRSRLTEKVYSGSML